MRPVSEGAPRLAVAFAARGACAHRGPRRSGTAARAARLIGAILAGGRATRFGGQPKGLLTVGGERVVDRIQAALQGVVDEVHVVRDDVRPSTGSLVGIHSALTLSNDDVLVVAWDMPFVTSQLLSMIRAALTPDAFAAVPVTSRPQPLCAAYSKRCLPILEAQLDAGRMRVMGFVDSLPVVKRLDESQLGTAGDPERLFFNANTPQALARAEEMARGG